MYWILIEFSNLALNKLITIKLKVPIIPPTEFLETRVVLSESMYLTIFHSTCSGLKVHLLQSQLKFYCLSNNVKNIMRWDFPHMVTNAFRNVFKDYYDHWSYFESDQIKMNSVSRVFQMLQKRSNTDNSFSLGICVQVQTCPFYSCDFWATCFHNYHNSDSIGLQDYGKSRQCGMEKYHVQSQQDLIVYRNFIS